MNKPDRSTSTDRNVPPAREPNVQLSLSGSSERPQATYSTGRFTRVLRWCAVGLIVGVSVLTMLMYFTLPETIPTHFNVAGQADAWGSRASILPLVGIGVAVTLGLAWGSRYPRAFNYPKVVTEDNAQRLYAVGERMMVWLAFACALLFAGILCAVIFGLSLSVFPMFGLTLLFGTVVTGIWQMAQA